MITFYGNSFIAGILSVYLLALANIESTFKKLGLVHGCVSNTNIFIYVSMYFEISPQGLLEKLLQLLMIKRKLFL